MEKPEHNEEYSTMSGDLGASQAATLALLADTARAARGGYGMGGEGGGYGSAYANPSTIQHGIECSRQSAEDHADATRDIMSLNVKNISDSFEAVNRAAQFTSIKDGQFQSELRTNDRILALQAEMNANARVADKCCCDLKLQSCQDKAEILAAIAASEGRGIERSLNAANAELTALKTQIACGCCAPR